MIAGIYMINGSAKRDSSEDKKIPLFRGIFSKLEMK